MRLFVLASALLVSFPLLARSVNIARSIEDASRLAFVPHSNALALNVEYDQLRGLREAVSLEIGRELTFFKGWNPEGEAHVTTITPPEFAVLKSHLSIEQINQIAEENHIQSSDLVVLGIGSGKAVLAGHTEETFFVIVDSQNLRKIRHQIYRAFVDGGGRRDAFDPSWFFPHITIGFTLQDLHENSGVIKNIRHSFDRRFDVQWTGQR